MGLTADGERWLTELHARNMRGVQELMDRLTLDELRGPGCRDAWPAAGAPGGDGGSGACDGTDAMGRTGWASATRSTSWVSSPGIGHSEMTDWRKRLWFEPPERFRGFGAPVVSPGRGEVVSAFDGVAGRRGCRSLPGIVWFFASSLVRGLAAMLDATPRGTAVVAGNHVCSHDPWVWGLQVSHLLGPGERLGTVSGFELDDGG